jgi:hypothetical protein
MGRNVESEMARRSAGTLAIPEPKRLISRRGEEPQTKPTQPEKKKEGQPRPAQPAENEPLTNLNRLKEFNGLFRGCAKAAENNKGGRKAERLRQSAERIRLYVIDSIKRTGFSIDWLCDFPDVASTWEMVSDQLWRERENMNVMQIQESVRAMTCKLFQLPADGLAELETTLKYFKSLKSIR